jgi:hypothetical protein
VLNPPLTAAQPAPERYENDRASQHRNDPLRHTFGQAVPAAVGGHNVVFDRRGIECCRQWVPPGRLDIGHRGRLIFRRTTRGGTRREGEGGEEAMSLAGLVRPAHIDRDVASGAVLIERPDVSFSVAAGSFVGRRSIDGLGFSIFHPRWPQASQMTATTAMSGRPGTVATLCGRRKSDLHDGQACGVSIIAALYSSFDPLNIGATRRAEPGETPRRASGQAEGRNRVRPRGAYVMVTTATCRHRDSCAATPKARKRKAAQKL